MSVHISVYIVYTVCITGGILGGMWKVCIRNFTLVAGFLICQYTFQYTPCMLCVTGDILGGTWKVCIRNFTLVAGFLICQVHISVYTMYTVYNRRYTGRYVEGVYTEFYTCGRIPYMSSTHFSIHHVCCV